MNITRITVIRRKNTADSLILHTDLPSGCWPYTERASFMTWVAQGDAEKYCSEHFPGIEIEVITDDA